MEKFSFNNALESIWVLIRRINRNKLISPLRPITIGRENKGEALSMASTASSNLLAEQKMTRSTNLTKF